MDLSENTQQALILILALLIAIPVHEFAHALSAVNNGDDGPRRDGRLSILPTDHFDPFGALFCVLAAFSGFGIGWGKPVLVNPSRLKNPKWAMCKIAAWGPFSNFLLAVGFAIIVRSGLVAGNDMLDLILRAFVSVNIALMLFNLIPIGPLDGAKILVTFLPDKQAYEYSRFMERWGTLLLLAVIIMPNQLLQPVLYEPLSRIMGMLLGP